MRMHVLSVHDLFALEGWAAANVNIWRINDLFLK